VNDRDTARKERPTNLERWFETLTPEQRSALGHCAARALWGPRKDALPKASDGPWVWPIDVNRYDRSPALTDVEREMLTRYAEAYRFYSYGRTMDFGPSLDRLIRPLNDVFDYTVIKTEKRRYVLLFFLREMADRNQSFWGWTTEEWIDSIEARRPARQHVIAAAYLLCNFSELHRLKCDHIVYNSLARKVFGREYTKTVIDRVQSKLAEWGYRSEGTRNMIMRTTFETLLSNRSPHLEDLMLDHLREVTIKRRARAGSYSVVALSRVLASIGATPNSLEIKRPIADQTRLPSLTSNVPAEWARLCRAWLERSTIRRRERNSHYYFFLSIGRWLAATHPETGSPANWTRSLAAEAVTAICEWHAGDWASSTYLHPKNRGKLMAATTRASRISLLRIFFRDLQDWELIPRRFDPRGGFMTPKSLLRLIGPNPRIIADDVWAKLVWAGLNLSNDDFPKRGSPQLRCRPISYPIELCRAVAATWLFAGLRNNEIRRLRLGCIRWQKDAVPIPGTTDTLPVMPSVCSMFPSLKAAPRLPSPLIGQWAMLSPLGKRCAPQGTKLPDSKTGELVDFLFLFRLSVIGKSYLNKVLIPVLCKKAGVPRADTRGNITSHRARSTIASQLFNAKEPMTLFELQEWLGHATPTATQHYAKITPTKLAKSYVDAGYFARNLRAIEVLIDQESVRNGRALTEPWKFYDLGHGYCTYDFFDQCPHRMACAKCSFYLPKESTKAHLLEAKANLLRLRQDIPLADAELSAVEEGLTAYEQLLANLADVPTPAGPTPRQLGREDLVQLQVNEHPTRSDHG
jgi:integrase